MRNVASLAVLAVLSGAASASPRVPSRPIPVLIVDGMNNHDWSRGSALLKAILEGSGRFSVEVSTAPDGLATAERWQAWRPAFANFRVVVVNYNGEHVRGQPSTSWPRPVELAFERFVRGGGGVVVYHAANNSFPAWPAWNEMIGLGWRPRAFGPSLVVSAGGRVVRVPAGQGREPGHGKEHEFVVETLNRNHPITRGLPPRWRHGLDQLTHGQHGPAAHLTVLDFALSRDTGEREPMDWTITYGRGRVFVTMLGHLWQDGADDAVRCAGFQTLLLRGTEWAATGRVTQAVPADFPGEDVIRLRR